MAVKRKILPPRTAHDRLNAMMGQILALNSAVNAIRRELGNELSQLHHEANERKKDCAAALRGVTTLESRLDNEHAANLGLRSDFEAFVANFNIPTSPPMPDLRGFMVPDKDVPGVSSYVRQAFNRALFPDYVVEKDLDFLIELYDKQPWQSHKMLLSIMKELKARRARDAQ